MTAHNTKITLTIAANYGGQRDMLQAVRAWYCASHPFNAVAYLGVWAPERFKQARIGSYTADAVWHVVNIFVTTVGAICEDLFNGAQAPDL